MSITKRKTSKGKTRYLVQVRKTKILPSEAQAWAWTLHAEGAVSAELASEPHLLPSMSRVVELVEPAERGKWRGRFAATLTLDRQRDAERWKVRVQDAIDHHRGPGLRADRTLSDALDLYLAGPAWRDLAERTKAKRRLRLEWWRRRRGHLPLSALSASLLADDRDALLAGEGAGGEPLANGTVYKYLSNLSRVLEYVRRDRGWIEFNPARQIHRPSVSTWSERPILHDDEYRRLMPEVESSEDPRLLPMVLLTLSSGARPSELARLTRRDVDAAAGTARVIGKGHRERVIRWHGRARDALLRHLQEQPAEISGHVFGGLTTARPYPRRAWEDARQAADLGHLPWYSLRGTAATWLAQLGASEHELMLFLGHTTSAAARHYVKLAHAAHSEIGPTLVRRLLAA